MHKTYSSSLNLDLVELFKKLSLDLDIDQRTVTYCIRRIKSEGMQFLTITLPSLGDTFLRSLDLKKWQINTAFRSSGGSRVPLHFRGLLGHIFSLDTGILRPDVSEFDIYRTLNFFSYFKKLVITLPSVRCTVKTRLTGHSGTRRYVRASRQAVVDFRELDRNLNPKYTSFWEDMRKNFLNHYPESSSLTVDDVLNVPARNTTGTTSSESDGLDPYVKRELKAHGLDKDASPSIVQKYMYPDFRKSGYRKLLSAFGAAHKPYPSFNRRFLVRSVTEGVPEDFSSELLIVPKTFKSSRTIVREPYHTLRLQMSLFDTLTRTLERDTSHRINFYSQEISRELALSSSLDGSLATIDLSSASDLVSFSLCLNLFDNCPALRYFLRNIRSRFCNYKEDLFDKRSLVRTFELNKLAGMGSGLTFPIMSLVIHLAICTRVSKLLGLKYARVMRKVFTYGDDIILPTEWYSIACDALHEVGLKVNSSKSFSQGAFRESCGMFAYNGVDITPCLFRLSGAKMIFPRSQRFDVATHIQASRKQEFVFSAERHCRELFRNGMLNTAEYLYQKIESILGVHLPIDSSDSSDLVRRFDYVNGVYTTREAHYESPCLSSDDIRVEHRIRVKHKDHINIGHLMDPYQHLGRILSKGNVHSLAELESKRPLRFGETPIPRGLVVFKNYSRPI